jgi:hypothetical protein
LSWPSSYPFTEAQRIESSDIRTSYTSCPISATTISRSSVFQVAGTIAVRHTLSETRAGHRFEPPKNGKGRTIRLTGGHRRTRAAQGRTKCGEAKAERVVEGSRPRLPQPGRVIRQKRWLMPSYVVCVFPANAHRRGKPFGPILRRNTQS